MALWFKFLYIVTMAPIVFSYCPEDKMHSFGICSFHIQCRGNIRGVRLPKECQGSINYPVVIDIVLTNAIEKFDERTMDTDFLESVTSLEVSGNWPSTNLAMLDYMPRLRSLTLANDHISHITGSPFFRLNRLELIDLSSNNLTNISELFVFEMRPNKMTRLLLAHNAVDEIPGYAFSELSSLIELDLSHNLISDLTEEPFLNLTALEILKLNNNRIKNLNGAVNNLQNLKHLFLRGNQIQNINIESLKIIYDLETFDISWNQLELLKPTIFSRHWNHFGSNSVCKIVLSENQITFVPNATFDKDTFDRFTRAAKEKSIGNDKNAVGKRFNNIDVTTELDLSKNFISSIEYNAFHHLVHLVSLDLSCNKITDFTVNPNDLEFVKYLNLSTNFITNLQFHSFWSMNNLQNLDLSHNMLDTIPDDTFTNNFNLKYVNMTYNEIKKLENLRIKMFHPEGGVLDLSNNSISRLSIPYGEGLRLTMLILQYNNISDVTLINLHYHSELENLDLSKNSIEELDNISLRLPVTLITLDLSFNLITNIGPASFHTVGHLRTLRLGHNKLSKIEYGAFQGLNSLEHLDLSFNNISYLDSKVLLDLKFLKILSLRFNGLHSLEYKSWYGHKFDLKVYLEGNSLTCEWLGAALSDFNNGFSKMRPAVLTNSITGHSLEGIPCINSEVGALTVPNVVMDERLLVIAKKILEAVNEQNHYLKRYILWASKSLEQDKDVLHRKQGKIAS